MYFQKKMIFIVLPNPKLEDQTVIISTTGPI